MSERGSFVTEYIYCSDCLVKMEKVLLQNEKELRGIRVESWRPLADPLPIIAGKIGGGDYGDESVVVQFNLFNKDDAPCHVVRMAVITDTNGCGILAVKPDGEVDILIWFSRDQEKLAKINC